VRNQTLLSMADLATPMALRVAATLRLGACIGAEGASIAQLAADTGTTQDALERLLQRLLAEDLLVVEDGRYRMTESGRDLASDDFCDRLSVTGARGRADLAFVELLTTVTTGAPAYRLRYGRGLWEDLAALPALDRTLRTRSGIGGVDPLPDAVGWAGWNAVSDVVVLAGGDARFLPALLDTWPRIRGVLIALPTTVAAVSDMVRSAGIQDRMSVEAGSVLGPLPKRGEAYVLFDVLRRWNDAQVGRLFERCAEAAGEDGSTIVIESIPYADGKSEAGAELEALLFGGAHDRPPSRVQELAGESGLGLRAAHELSGHAVLMEFACTTSSTDHGWSIRRGDEPVRRKAADW
jgi:hypothetical protein